MSEADVCDKFRRNATLALPDAAVLRLQEGILGLDEREDVRDLVAASC